MFPRTGVSGRKVTQLTEARIRSAKPRERPYKLFDERGLFLFVTPTGGRLWRLRYRIGPLEKLISLGAYPDVTLKRAREKRDEARKLVADEIDPSVERQARRAAWAAGRLFRYAVARGRAQHDVAADLKDALAPVKSRNFASVTDPVRVGGLMQAIDGYSGHPVMALALKLAPLVFVRPGELRGAEWSEFDLQSAEWRIPGARMKMGEPHIAPVSRQALVIVRELEPFAKGGLQVFCVGPLVLLGRLWASYGNGSDRITDFAKVCYIVGSCLGRHDG